MAPYVLELSPGRECYRCYKCLDAGEAFCLETLLPSSRCLEINIHIYIVFSTYCADHGIPGDVLRSIITYLAHRCCRYTK
jgi:hypothetical protein